MSSSSSSATVAENPSPPACPCKIIISLREEILGGVHRSSRQSDVFNKRLRVEPTEHYQCRTGHHRHQPRCASSSNMGLIRRAIPLVSSTTGGLVDEVRPPAGSS